MATNLKGLIYYKLDADVHGYKNDITKNGSLRGEEIDGNFHFLRGNDIENMSFEENGTLLIKRYNGEILTAKQSSNQDYDFKYDPETNSLIIIKPNGEEIRVEGFNTIVNIHHDETLEGDGTETNPLMLSIDIQEVINNLLTQIKNATLELDSVKLELQKTKEELTSIKSNMITSIEGEEEEIFVSIENNVAKIKFDDNACFIAG